MRPNGARTFLALLMSLLGHFRPWSRIDADSSLSPDSCRAGRMLMTAESGHQRTHAPQQNHVIVLRQDAFIPFGLERGHRGSRECREGSRGGDAEPPPRHVLTGGSVRLH